MSPLRRLRPASTNDVSYDTSRMQDQRLNVQRYYPQWAPGGRRFQSGMPYTPPRPTRQELEFTGYKYGKEGQVIPSIGYAPSYWEHPQRVARYYHALNAFAPG